MSQANPTHRKQFPLGRALFIAGLVGIVLTIALLFYRIYDGTRATHGTIPGPAPATITLPNAGDYVITRAEGISTDRSLDASIEHPRPDGSTLPNTSFAPDTNDRYITLKGNTNHILGQFTAPHAGQATITASAAAYPLVVRREPLAWAVANVKLAAVLGSIAAATTAFGGFIAVRRFNEKQRAANHAFQDLVRDTP